MPIYEYVCRQCGAEIEKLQALSDAPLTDCAECGESALKRKISAPGFRLSGGGWYETDFKKDGRRNLAGDNKGSSDNSGGSGESGKSDGGKSDNKSDTASSGSKSEGKGSKSGSKDRAAGGK